MPGSQDIVLGSMFWQSFQGIVRYNFTTNYTQLIFQLNQNGPSYYLNGTSISNAPLGRQLSYNISIEDGTWPGLIPLVPIQNIEGSQSAKFSIALVAAKTTTFGKNCTFNLAGNTGNCSSPPINADTMFTAEGFANSGTYPSTSITGYTTSGNVEKGYFCMTDILSTDGLQ